MVTIDDHTTNVIEIGSQAALLSEELLLKLFKKLNEFLGDKQNNVNDKFINDKTKEGKQSIKDLINKHKDGVVALDENLTKEQLKDYKKEFKKLGVDFSVVKNDDNTHSFFFAAEQSNIIEKALKNIVENKSAVLESNLIKDADNDISNLKVDLSKEQALFTKELYDKVSLLPTGEELPKELEEEINNLTDKQRELFDKLSESDSLKKTLYSEILDEDKSVLGNKILKTLDQDEINLLKQKSLDKDKSIEFENNLPKEKVERVYKFIEENKISDISFEDLETQIKNAENELSNKVLSNEDISFKLVNSLDKKELEVLKAFNNPSKFEELKKDLSEEQLKNVNTVLENSVAPVEVITPSDEVENSKVKIPSNFLDLEIEKAERRNEALRGNTPPNKDVLVDYEVKDKLNENLNSDEKELFKQLAKVDVEGLRNEKVKNGKYSVVELEKYQDAKANFTPEQIAKVEKLYNENVIASDKDSKDKLSCAVVGNLLDKEEKVNVIKKELDVESATTWAKLNTNKIVEQTNDDDFHKFTLEDKEMKISKMPDDRGSFNVFTKDNESDWKRVNVIKSSELEETLKANRTFVNSLSDDEKNLFKQAVAAREESLTSSDNTQQKKYNEMKKELPAEQVEKIEKLVPTHEKTNFDITLTTEQKLLDKIESKLDKEGINLADVDQQTFKDKFNKFLNKTENKILDKLAAKGIDLRKSKNSSIESNEFSMSKVKESAKTIKDNEQDKDKNKKQELSR